MSAEIHNKHMDEVRIDYRPFRKLAQIIDISWPVTEESTTWRDNNPTTFRQDAIFEKDGKRSTTITMHAHTGTHVDAPSHFLKDGQTIEKTKLSDLIGLTKVFDFSEVDSVNESGKITKEDFLSLKSQILDLEGIIVLLKTKNSYQYLSDSKWKQEFIYLDASGAEFLAEKRVRAVGIDYIGIERSDIQKDHATHETLLQHNIPIIEGLRLAHAPGLTTKENSSRAHQGIYYLVCLPLRVEGIEAAPARAILLPIDYQM